MRRNPSFWLLLTALVALIAGCATPSQPENHRPLLFPKGTSQAKKTPGFLLGGDGTDIGTALLCPHQDTCLLFGQTINSFAADSDILVVQASPNGDVDWARRYGGQHTETLRSVSPGQNGDLLLAGSTKSNLTGGTDSESEPMPTRPLLLVIDSRGKPQWGGVIQKGAQKILDTAPTPDGGYVLAGYGKMAGKGVNAVVIKVTSHGQIAWAKSYDLGEDESANAIAVGSHGSLMVAGATVGSNHTPKAFSMALTADGTIQHSVFYSGRNSLYFIRKTSGGYLVGGQHDPSGHGALLALKINAKGQPSWSYTYRTPAPVTPLSLTTRGHGQFLITGRTRNNAGRVSGIASEFNARGAPLADLIVGGKGVAEFLAAASLTPRTYLLWGETTLFDASKVDMLGVSWATGSGTGSDFKRQKLAVTAHKAPIVQRTLSLGYKTLTAVAIPSPIVKLQ